MSEVLNVVGIVALTTLGGVAIITGVCAVSWLCDLIILWSTHRKIAKRPPRW